MSFPCDQISEYGGAAKEVSVEGFSPQNVINKEK